MHLDCVLRTRGGPSTSVVKTTTYFHPDVYDYKVVSHTYSYFFRIRPKCVLAKLGLTAFNESIHLY